MLLLLSTLLLLLLAVAGGRGGSSCVGDPVADDLTGEAEFGGIAIAAERIGEG